MASKPGDCRIPGTKARRAGVPSARGWPACCPGGARCRGGVSSSRALAWNRRTCRQLILLGRGGGHPPGAGPCRVPLAPRVVQLIGQLSAARPPPGPPGMPRHAAAGQTSRAPSCGRDEGEVDGSPITQKRKIQNGCATLRVPRFLTKLASRVGSEQAPKQQESEALRIALLARCHAAGAVMDKLFQTAYAQ
jgi:hypothetical protein